jgi:hypothetical protein
MIHLLDRLLYFRSSHVIRVAGQPFEIRRDQIFCWVSLTSPFDIAWDDRFSAHRFPVLIDTGHGHNFTLHAEHLKTWAGLAPSDLIPLGSLEVNGRRVRLWDAAVWLFPNRPGTSEIDPEHPPFRIDLDDGISVVPGRRFPRVPLLGLRPFRLNGLRLNIDGTTQLVSLTAQT